MTSSQQLQHAAGKLSVAAHADRASSKLCWEVKLAPQQPSPNGESLLFAGWTALMCVPPRLPEVPTGAGLQLLTEVTYTVKHPGLLPSLP